MEKTGSKNQKKKFIHTKLRKSTNKLKCYNDKITTNDLKSFLKFSGNKNLFSTETFFTVNELGMNWIHWKAVMNGNFYLFIEIVTFECAVAAAEKF